MERRVAGRTSTPFLLTRQALTLVFAAALLVVVGPGAVGAPARPDAQAQSSLTSAGARSDPIGDLALKLEFDVDRIFRFVADEISYQPYPGILRGALGTLQARAGNSVDKALLLAALLDESAVLYRFARGPLDEATSAALLDTMATGVEDARQIAKGPLLASLEQLPGGDAQGAPPASGPLVTLYAKQAEAIAAEAQTRFELAATRLAGTVSMIEGALDEAGIRLPADALSLPPAEVVGHTWVQAAFGPEWRDLDPTLSASEPGTVLTLASETLERLPDDLRYRVRLEVLVERVEGGRLVTDAVLSHEDFADQLAGVPVAFSHVTPSAFQRLGITLSSLLGEGWIGYRPTLDLGLRALVADHAVAFPIAGGSSDIFSVEASPTTGGGGPVEGEATAEWLEVRVTPPGSEPAVARRMVFDRVPAHVRHGGAPTVDAVEPITLVDLEGTGSVDYPPMGSVETFVIATAPTSAAPVFAASDDGLGMFALAYHALRAALSTEMVLDAGARTFIDGPNIVSVSVEVDQDATAPDLGRSVRVGLDIWHRRHGILPLTGGSITAAEAEVFAGVTDHLAERFALERLAEGLGSPARTIGVGEVFEAAAAQGIPTRVLHGAVPDALPYGPQATASIDAAVSAGGVVVVPAEPVTVGDTQRVGWWAIDPRTGETTDVMDDGSGAEMAEQTALAETRLGWVKCRGAMAGQAAREIAWAASRYLWASRLGSLAIYRSWQYGSTSCWAL